MERLPIGVVDMVAVLAADMAGRLTKVRYAWFGIWNRNLAFSWTYY